MNMRRRWKRKIEQPLMFLRYYLHGINVLEYKTFEFSAKHFKLERSRKISLKRNLSRNHLPILKTNWKPERKLEGKSKRFMRKESNVVMHIKRMWMNDEKNGIIKCIMMVWITQSNGLACLGNLYWNVTIPSEKTFWILDFCKVCFKFQPGWVHY